ncbi:hypothetical protein AVEN_69009-1 [Araneus ventricosus]|uniref:Uncharacterized protein n=1 Tax=Araneus ventricosus TaxID=182803 RepID=A0A4Y2HZY0_ARAVE|nr:hypothetical protein AVEN_69009-1 [Araneus ventricosus]
MLPRTLNLPPLFPKKRLNWTSAGANWIARRAEKSSLKSKEPEISTERTWWSSPVFLTVRNPVSLKMSLLKMVIYLDHVRIVFRALNSLKANDYQLEVFQEAFNITAAAAAVPLQHNSTPFHSEQIMDLMALAFLILDCTTDSKQFPESSRNGHGIR